MHQQIFTKFFFLPKQLQKFTKKKLKKILSKKYQIVTKFKNSNFDNSRTQFVMNQKLKLWQLRNSKCDNSKTQTVTKPKIVRKLKNSSFEKSQNSNCERKKKIKLWQSFQTEIAPFFLFSSFPFAWLADSGSWLLSSDSRILTPGS